MDDDVLNTGLTSRREGLLSVIVLAYHSGDKLDRVVEELANCMVSHNIPYEVVIIDEGNDNADAAGREGAAAAEPSRSAVSETARTRCVPIHLRPNPYGPASAQTVTGPPQLGEAQHLASSRRRTRSPARPAELHT